MTVDLYSFLPDASRARALDTIMHDELAASLGHLADATSTELPGLSRDIATAARRIVAGQRMPPLAFAHYFRLAQALIIGDRDFAMTSASMLSDIPARPVNLPIRAIGNPDAEPLKALLDEDIDPLLHMAPVPDADAQSFRHLVGEGLSLMQAELPELHAEITAIVHEILLGHAKPGSTMEFDGASHFQYWGLLMLNPRHHKTPLAVVEVLTHEASHSLLFGLTAREPLVHNGEDERYASPLRDDARPMYGIYHATYVSARMAWAMERLAASSTLPASDRAIAADLARADRENFHKGYDVVKAHARMSETGEKAMAAAVAWISA